MGSRSPVLNIHLSKNLPTMKSLILILVVLLSYQPTYAQKSIENLRAEAKQIKKKEGKNSFTYAMALMSLA